MNTTIRTTLYRLVQGTALVALCTFGLTTIAHAGIGTRTNVKFATNPALSAEARRGSIPMLTNPTIEASIYGFSGDQKFVWVAFETDKQPGTIFAYFSCKGSDEQETSGIVVDTDLDDLPGTYTYMAAFNLDIIRTHCQQSDLANLTYGAESAIGKFPSHRTLQYRANGTIWYPEFNKDGWSKLVELVRK